MTAAGTRRAQRSSTPRPRGRLVAGTLSVLLLVGVVVGGVLVSVHEDGTGAGAGAGAVGEPGSATPTSEAPDPLDDPLSPESIDLRYAALADSVTAGATGCRRGKVRQGQTERLVCDTSVGDLELVTYASRKELRNRRDKAVTDLAGGILDEGDDGTLMGFESMPFEPPADKPRAKPTGPVTFLYSDSATALRSVNYTATRGADLDPLVATYDATGPTRPFPTEPTTPDLVAFAERWVRPEECVRIVTINAGALEESYCDPGGPLEVFVGRFATMKQLKAYRKVLVASAIADDRDLREWRRGALYEYMTDDGTVSRYWDDPDCLCYAEAFRADGTYAQLRRWWER